MDERLLQIYYNTDEGGGTGGTKTIEQMAEELDRLSKETVSKELYEQLVGDNAKLIKALSENRTVVKDAEPTKQDILDRCKERTKSMEDGNTLQRVKALVENHRDMQLLEMDTELVDDNAVEFFEGLIEESKGDDKLFTALMQSRIKK